MSGHFKVLASELLSSKEKAASVASGVGALDPGGELSKATGSIPGGVQRHSDEERRLLWNAQFKQLRERVSSYGDTLGTAAAGYERGDNAGAKSFNDLVPELRGDGDVVADQEVGPRGPARRSRGAALDRGQAHRSRRRLVKVEPPTGPVPRPTVRRRSSPPSVRFSKTG